MFNLFFFSLGSRANFPLNIFYLCHGWDSHQFIDLFYVINPEAAAAIYIEYRGTVKEL